MQVNTWVDALSTVRFEDNSRKPGSLDSMLWKLTDPRGKQLKNRNLREAIRVEIRHITDELAYHDMDGLDPAPKSKLVDFLVSHVLQNFALFGSQAKYQSHKANESLTLPQKQTLALLFPPLITALIEAREQYKANPDAKIKVQLVGHENDNYRLFVEKRMAEGKWVFDLTSEMPRVNQMKGTSIEYGKLMYLEALGSKEQDHSPTVFEKSSYDITFII